MSPAASCFFVPGKKQDRPPVSDAEWDKVAGGICSGMLLDNAAEFLQRIVFGL